MSASRDGAALALVLLVLLALTVLGHAALQLGRSERRAAEGVAEAVSNRLRTRALLRAAVSELADDSLPERLEAVDTVRVRGGGSAEVRRVTREVLRISAVRARSGTSVVPGETLVWSLSPLERAARPGAVLALGGVFDGGADGVSSANYFVPDTDDIPLCAPFLEALDSVARSVGAPSSVGALDIGGVQPDPAQVGSPALPLPPGLGALPGDTVLARLPALAPGRVTPAPRASPSSECEDEPTNWGSPGDPAGPCGRRTVVGGVAGALEVVGGEGQGLLAVAGDLVFSDGARFSGLVLVGGDLVLEDGARLRGAARVRGGTFLDAEAHIVGAACPVLHSLSTALPLRRPLLLPAPVLFH